MIIKPTKDGKEGSINGKTESPNDIKIESVVSEIDADNLAKVISLPIESARAAFVTDSVTVKSYEEFLKDKIPAFYIQLMRGTKWLPPENVETKIVESEAFALLERGFSNKGGIPAAMDEARNGINGGLRFVFDTMTEKLVQEEKEKYVTFALKKALDPLDWESKVAFIEKLFKKLENILPEETRAEPERFAGHYEKIVTAYVNSINHLNTLFRRL
jgi:hypothetical protein